MKYFNKSFVVLLIVSMLITFASCGENVTPSPETTTQSAETTTHIAVESVNLNTTDEDFGKLNSVARGI